MKVVSGWRMRLAPALLLLSGCAFVPRSSLEAVQSQNRVLAEQNRAQLAEIANLQTHSRNTEDQLANAEEKLAALDDQLGLTRKQLINYQSEREQLHQQVKGLADSHLAGDPRGQPASGGVVEALPEPALRSQDRAEQARHRHSFSTPARPSSSRVPTRSSTSWSKCSNRPRPAI